jgi:hypothetical protein
MMFLMTITTEQGGLFVTSETNYMYFSAQARLVVDLVERRVAWVNKVATTTNHEEQSMIHRPPGPQPAQTSQGADRTDYHQKNNSSATLNC